MEELLELRRFIEQEQYPAALSLIEEMDEMSREDKINKIRSFAKILLLHLIKQTAEQRLTRSWELSIANSLSEIYYTNNRRKSKGYYLDEAALHEVLLEAYPLALKGAALEAFEGGCSAKEIDQKVDKMMIVQEALQQIVTFDPN